VGDQIAVTRANANLGTGNLMQRPALPPAFAELKSMPYALFSNDAKLSKAYPTEADVWKVARKSGLVVDVSNNELTRCWTMTTRSSPAIPSRTKILPATRQKPNATPNHN
jgi:hypothetical protein